MRKRRFLSSLLLEIAPASVGISLPDFPTVGSNKGSMSEVKALVHLLSAEEETHVLPRYTILRMDGPLQLRFLFELRLRVKLR